LVGGGEFDPAEVAGGVFFDDWHSSSKVLFGGTGSKGGDSPSTIFKRTR
jgi:hypothetical protein